MDLPIVDCAADLLSKAIDFLFRKCGSVGESQSGKLVVFKGAIASVKS